MKVIGIDKHQSETLNYDELFFWLILTDSTFILRYKKGIEALLVIEVITFIQDDYVPK